MFYIIDSYAWVEYFLGSRKGEVLRVLFLDEKNRFYTIECCLAEIKGWSLRERKAFDELFAIIRTNSTMLPLNEQDWINAGQERFEQRKTRAQFGLIDATLLVKQKELSCKIISGDPHFRGLKDIVFLEQDN